MASMKDKENKNEKDKIAVYSRTRKSESSSSSGSEDIIRFLEATARAGRLGTGGLGRGDESDAMKKSSSSETVLAFDVLAAESLILGRGLLLPSDGMVSKKSAFEPATLVFFVGLIYSSPSS